MPAHSPIHTFADKSTPGVIRRRKAWTALTVARQLTEEMFGGRLEIDVTAHREHDVRRRPSRAAAAHVPRG